MKKIKWNEIIEIVTGVQLAPGIARDAGNGAMNRVETRWKLRGLHFAAFSDRWSAGVPARVCFLRG